MKKSTLNRFAGRILHSSPEAGQQAASYRFTLDASGALRHNR
jgi:hypothetical protein